MLARQKNPHVGHDSPGGVVAASPLRGPDRRMAQRSRALLAGKLIVGNGAMSSDCTIRDMTDGGARIRISHAVGLPKAVMLLVIKDGLVFEANVAWRRGDELGLEFTRRMDVRDEAMRSLGLRALWAELTPR